MPTKILTTLLQNGEFHLENHVLKVVEVGQSDTYNTTVLHVPDLDLVIIPHIPLKLCYY